MAASGCRYADAAARLEAMAALEARLGEREEELGRVSASKEKLAAMVTSLQAALHACEQQLRRTQAARQAAHSQLSQWLPHWHEYTTPAALQLLEAQAAARRGVRGGGGATEEVVADLLARAAARRAEVREAQAQLADSEAPPSTAPEGPHTPPVRVYVLHVEPVGSRGRLEDFAFGTFELQELDLPRHDDLQVQDKRYLVLSTVSI